MEAQKELKKWMAEYKKANTAEKLADHKTRFLAFLNSLSEEDKKEFVAAFQEAAKKTVKESKEIVKTINARTQLQDVLDFTSMSYIAKNYFGKSRQWLYQRINESVVNGNKVNFTKDDLKKLSIALSELGDKMKDASNSIKSFSDSYSQLDDATIINLRTK